MTGGAADGVTKFDLDYQPAPALPRHELVELNAWRSILWRLQLIGRDAARYGGVGFGNVSRRLPPGFIITGTQTGDLPQLDPHHYTRVEHADPARNRVVARGPVAPSSESLTHAMLYALDDSIQFVFHVHSPAIWHAADRLALPATAADVAYGTPAMAHEMRRLYSDRAFGQRGVIVMRGHADGVIAVGARADEAGTRLLTVLAQALAGGGDRAAG